MNSPQDTIVAVATPIGEGGLGVIRLSGAKAIDIVSGLFSKNIRDASANTCQVGTLQAETPIDQVVVTLFRTPHSYTGEDVIEISAHGSPVTLQKIVNACLQKGARLAAAGEFTERAFLNGKMDLTQAEAVAELIHAKSDKSQKAALAQLQGHLAKKVRELRDHLVPLLAHIEVGLDHSDEDHDFLARTQLKEKCQTVQKEIDVLLDSARVSKILREGFHVALLGRPNVGKSSLMNALLKVDRAIVTPIPGTTRDTLEESLHIQGIPVVLTDTAGLRSKTEDPIEQLGMERTRQSLEGADLVIGLFDGSASLTQEDEGVIQQALSKPHVWVINKTDLPQQFSTESLHHLNGKAEVISLSAKTGKGLEALTHTISELALREKAGVAEAHWLLNTRHQAALERAKEALERASSAAKENAFEECVALELQTALGALGEIIGETTTEDLLDQIFSTFCIGK